MHEQVVERKAEVAAEAGGDDRADAFTLLVKSNQDESSKYQLDDQELACLFLCPSLQPRSCFPTDRECLRLHGMHSTLHTGLNAQYLVLSLRAMVRTLCRSGLTE